MAVGEFKIFRLQDKLEKYKKSLDYLNEWCKENQELSLKISRWLNENSDKFELKHLKQITQYHIEISKILYASIALLDKIYRNEERLEKWKKDLQDVR